MKKLITLASIFILHSNFSYSVTPGLYNNPVNCSMLFDFSHVTNDSFNYFSQQIPTAEMVHPWEGWKENFTDDVTSYYGTFFRLNSSSLPSDLPYELSIISYGSTTPMKPGSIASGFYQWWSQPLYVSAKTIYFDQSSAATLRATPISGNYYAGKLYKGTFNLSIYSGSFNAPKSYSHAQAINALMTSSLPTVCEYPIQIRVLNSCSVTADPIEFGSVTTADISNNNVTHKSNLSIQCLLNDSASLSISGNSVDHEGNTLVSMGSNLQTKLTLIDENGKTIMNHTPLTVKGGVPINTQLISSLEAVDKSKPMIMSNVSGNAIATLTFN